VYICANTFERDALNFIIVDKITIYTWGGSISLLLRDIQIGQFKPLVAFVFFFS
jgi:hypothetical protein